MNASHCNIGGIQDRIQDAHASCEIAGRRAAENDEPAAPALCDTYMDIVTEFQMTPNTGSFAQSWLRGYTAYRINN